VIRGRPRSREIGRATKAPDLVFIFLSGTSGNCTFLARGESAIFGTSQAWESSYPVPHFAAGGLKMKKLVLAAAAVALMSTGGAIAQTTVTTGAARATVQIEPEARTRIRGYVTEHKLRPITTKERIVVGATVPNDVELVAVPSEWGPSLTRYRYVYSNDRVRLVDPGTRTVVQEID
jgi:hypothetical protein